MSEACSDTRTASDDPIWPQLPPPDHWHREPRPATQCHGNRSSRWLYSMPSPLQASIRRPCPMPTPGLLSTLQVHFECHAALRNGMVCRGSYRCLMGTVHRAVDPAGERTHDSRSRGAWGSVARIRQGLQAQLRNRLGQRKLMPDAPQRPGNRTERTADLVPPGLPLPVPCKQRVAREYACHPRRSPARSGGPDQLRCAAQRWTQSGGNHCLGLLHPTHAGFPGWHRL